MRHVVVGSGAAGTRAVEVLRKEDPSSEVLMLTEESQPGYYRFYLPDVITGKRSLESVFIHPPSYYDDQKIEVRLGTVVERILPESREVSVGGERVGYDRLLIATGSSPRRMRCEGGDLAGVVYLRSLSDALGIRDFVGRARKAVAVGGGLLGVEMARSFQQRGVETEYLIREERFWPEMMDAEGSRIIENILKQNGLSIRKGESLGSIYGDGGRVTGVRTLSGREIEADIVGIAIGVIPRIGLLEDSGIEIDSGVVVGRDLQANAKGVFAAGDVAQAPDVARGGHTITTSWKKAWDQGRIAALNMLGRKEESGGGMPSNTIKIYDLPVACMGVTNPVGGGYESRTEIQAGGDLYRKLMVRDGRLVGAILIGDMNGMALLEQLMRKGSDIDGARSALKSAGYELADLLD